MKKLKPSRTKLSSSRWAAYAAAGTATAAGLATSADADITHVTVNQRVDAAGGGSLAQFPFVLAGGGAELIFGHYRFASSSSLGAGLFIAEGAASAKFVGVAAGNYRYVGKLGSNVGIASKAFVSNRRAGTSVFFGTLASKTGFTRSQWKTAGTGFIGFKFNAGAGSQYGWARLTVDGTPGNAYTLVDYAYGDVGETIRTGQLVSAIPEPGSLGLLALGSVGLIAWRRRRSAETAS
jgi:hypothetical protein